MAPVASIRLLLVGAPGGAFRLAAEMARAAGAEVVMADDGADALAHLRATGADLVMIDIDADVAGFIGQARAERFSVPVLACGIDAPADKAVAAIRAGARDYVPLPPDANLIAAAIATVMDHTVGPLIGRDPGMERALRVGLAIARSRSPILIEGEAGTGKERLARAIHAASGATGRFIALDVAGLAPEIVEAELFGQDQGACSPAAARRTGCIEQARDGTLFIREVAALTPGIQARLHAVLHDHSFRRTRGRATIVATARIIASTGVDLDARVAQGGFRRDLLARLGLARLILPPLRSRSGDIAALAAHFVDRFARTENVPVRALPAETVAALHRHAWPGNVRELEDVIHRAVLLARSGEIRSADLLLADGTSLADAPAPQAGALEGLVGHTVEEVERALILQTLGHCHGNRTSASTILGISVRTMRNKLRTFIEAGIPVSPALTHDR